MYILLPNKTEKIYRVMFDLITVAVPDFKPKMVHVDFELAITNALKNYFPNTIIYRCYYHLTQSLWKKAKMIDGCARAKTVKSKILRRLVGLCCILPLLPIDMVSKGWSYINEEYHEINDKKVNTFIKGEFLTAPLFRILSKLNFSSNNLLHIK